MKNKSHFDVIIVGGSYSGLAAGMALGRSLRKVLIIDSGIPCNRQTPHSHNFLTHDGKTPSEISSLGKEQVAMYSTVEFFNGLAINARKTDTGFEIAVESGEVFHAGKLIFATGIKDILPAIEGFAECWGISVLHCPYCHGYEVRNQPTGIVANGELAFEFVKLISNWTNDLVLYTNGASTLTEEQTAKLAKHSIRIVEKAIERLEHSNGHIEQIVFKDTTREALSVIYSRNAFEQHCTLPQLLGCSFTEDGYIQIDALQKTSVKGVYACGDNVTRMRTVANAVAMGTMSGMAVNKELVEERF